MKLVQTTVTFLAAFSALPAAFSQSIVEIAVNDGRFTTLVQALTDADLVEALSGEGPFTVFAPVDDAFAAVPPKFLEEPMYSEHLKNILLYHVVGGDGQVMSTDLMLNMEAETLNGESITVTSLDPVQINGVDVIIPDIDADNGVIHVVDEVLLPTAATKSIVDLAVETPELSTLVELLTATANLVDVLSGEGPFTVFAPTNDAFAKLPADTVAALTDPANIDELTNILTFHVINGAIVLSSNLAESEQVSIMAASMSSPPALDASIVTAPDILANNGVIHLIDSVLMPSAADDTKEVPEDDSSSASSVAIFAMMQSAVVLAAALML